MNQKYLRHVVINLFLAGILFLIISGIWVYKLYQKPNQVNSDIVTNYLTLRAANQSMMSINEAAIDVSAFLITNDLDTIKQLPETIISAKLSMATMRKLISDNVTEIAIFNKLKPLADKKIEFLQQIVALTKSGNKPAALKLAADQERLMLTNDINELILQVKKVEIGQQEQAKPTFQFLKADADRSYILLGILNVAWFLITYILMRQYLDLSKGTENTRY